VPESTMTGELISPMYSGGMGRGEDENISHSQIMHCSHYGLWTGVISTAWTDPGNWICNQLPHRFTDVTIPAGVPNFPHLSNATVNIRNLTLLSNSQLHVHGVRMNVWGN